LAGAGHSGRITAADFDGLVDAVAAAPRKASKSSPEYKDLYFLVLLKQCGLPVCCN